MQHVTRIRRPFVLLIACIFFLGACSNSPVHPSNTGAWDATPVVYTPVASGQKVLRADGVQIDISNVSQGYIMVQYTGTNSRPKLQITCPDDTVYTYNITPNGDWETFPLTGGDGAYVLHVYENIEGEQYALACRGDITVQLEDAFVPFLYPNQYVYFQVDSAVVLLGQTLAQGADDEIDVVERVYHYVINNIRYDCDKAVSVQSSYLPDVDKVLETKKGICFDYAALTASILRTQHIPTKLVVGYAGKAYHAWISVYVEGTGWVDGIIEFKGDSWVRMDPTFAVGGSDMSDTIGDGSNYHEMYRY